MRLMNGTKILNPSALFEKEQFTPISFSYYLCNMGKLELIKEEILSLTSDEKEIISIFLHDSMQPNVSASEYDLAWKEELKVRLSEVESGKVKGIKSADALAEIRSKLKK